MAALGQMAEQTFNHQPSSRFQPDDFRHIDRQDGSLNRHVLYEGTRKIRLGQVRFLQLTYRKECTFQIGSRKIVFLQPATGEIGSRQVGYQIRLLFPPGIPRGSA